MQLLIYLIMTMLSVEMSLCTTLSHHGRQQFHQNIKEQEDTRGPPTNCNNLHRCNDSDKSKNRKVVCATNGKTYKSQCAFRLASCTEHNIKFKHFGECRLKEKCIDQRKNALALKQRKGVFVPKCNPDGTFSRVQCHEYTGFCWCAYIDGIIVADSAVQGTKPNCTNTSKEPIRKGGSSDGRNSNSGGCVGKLRKSFNKRMIREMKTEYMYQPVSGSKGKSSKKNTPSDAEALRYKFESLDKRKDSKLKKSEYRKFRKLVKDKVKPSKCAKNFHKFCDINSDKIISLKEWMDCFNSTKVKRTSRKKGEGSRHPVLQPEAVIKDMTPLCKKEMDQWQEMYSEGNVTQFKPECDSKGLYKPIQCFGSNDKNSWYCFCVHKHTGNMIANTSILKSKGTPDCSGVVYKWPDCPHEILFLKKLLYYFHREIEVTEDAKFESLDSNGFIKLTDEEIIQYFFRQTDVNKNNKTEGKEKKLFRKILKKDSLLKTCGRRILKICDLNKDGSISLNEWIECILSTKTTENEVATDSRIGPPNERNPFIEYLTPED